MSGLFKCLLFLVATHLSHTAAATAAAPAPISALQWMAGQWQSELQGSLTEVSYTTPAGGLILGQTKISRGDTIEFFEFEKIMQVGDTLILQPMPFGKPGVNFALKEIGANRVVFENPQHDFPTRILFELKANGLLLARIEGTQHGQPVVEDFLLAKVK